MCGSRALIPVTVLALVVSWGPSPAHAQAPADSPGVRVGGFTLAPAVSFSSGWNSNVNHESPAVEAYENTPHLHLGFANAKQRVEVEGFGAIEFSRYSVPEESGHNAHASLRVATGGPKLRVFSSYFLRDGGARPTGFEEISERSRRIEQRVEGGFEVGTGARLSFGAGALFSPTRYSADAMYQGSSLDEKLTFNRTGYNGSVWYQLTPLTRVGVRADWISDHFLKSPERDTNIRRVMGGIELSEPAIVTGALYIGTMTTEAPDVGAPPYTGLSAAGVLTFAPTDATLVQFRTLRDTNYSVETDLSYYISSLIDVSWRQDIVGPVEGFLFADWFKLRYQGSDDIEGDDQFGLGAGVAVRIGRYVRVGVNVDSTERTGRSPWTSQRVIGFVTYGVGFRQVERPIPTDRYR